MEELTVGVNSNQPSMALHLTKSSYSQVTSYLGPGPGPRHNVSFQLRRPYTMFNVNIVKSTWLNIIGL